MSEVVFIGTSDAFGAGGRRQSAILLRDGSGTVLLDCGGTTNTGLGQLGIERDEIEAILVSHFHADHFAGIPSLLLAARYEDERRHPIEIAGPPGVERRVRDLARAMGHHMDSGDWPFEIRFRELPENGPHEVGPVSVRAFETNHQPEANPQGYRIRAGNHTIVYSGDTGWFDELPAAVAGADLFICECTLRRPGLDFHLNHELLCERRADFDCRDMVLTHLGAEMADRANTGPFQAADDGLVLKL